MINERINKLTWADEKCLETPSTPFDFHALLLIKVPSRPGIMITGNK